MAKRIVEQFLKGDFGPGFITDTYGVPQQEAFDHLQAAAATAKSRAELAAAIQADFGKTAQELLADPSFKTLFRDVRDSIVAVFIDLTARSLPIADLARLARLMDLITRVAADDASLEQPGAIQGALSETLLLPTAVFPLRRGLPQPVGVGDLLVVNST